MQLLAAFRSATSSRGWHTGELKREQCNSGKVSALQSRCTINLFRHYGGVDVMFFQAVRFGIISVCWLLEGPASTQSHHQTDTPYPLACFLPWASSLLSRYTLYVKAWRRAIAAKNISTQMMKSWYPAATVPSPTDTLAECILGMAPHFSKMANSIPKQSNKRL